MFAWKGWAIPEIVSVFFRITMFSTLGKFIARLSVREYDILKNKDTFKRPKSKMALDFKNYFDT